MRHKKLFLLLAQTIALALAVSCQAYAQQSCTSIVTNALVYKGGAVLVLPAFRQDFIQVCNIDVAWKDISPSTCAAWIGHLRSAVARKSTITIWYAENTPCNAIQYYGNAPSPVYIGVND